MWLPPVSGALVLPGLSIRVAVMLSSGVESVHHVEQGEFPGRGLRSMKVEVYFYGNLIHLAGGRVRTVWVEESAPRVSDLRAAIAREIPEIVPHLRQAAVGMGTELLSDDALLRPDAEISLLPPVSGG